MKSKYDPTDTERGWHRYPQPNRRLRRFEHLQGHDRTVALTKCVSFKLVTLHRHRAPRTDIGSTLLRADELGLDVNYVRDEYRRRVDNGGGRPNLVNIETNATFRGA